LIEKASLRSLSSFQSAIMSSATKARNGFLNTKTVFTKERFRVSVILLHSLVNCPERIQPISPKKHLYKTYKNNLLWQKLPITVAQSGTKNGL
jgi:hypothetical protein